MTPNSTGNLRVSGSIIPVQQTSTVTPGTTATVGPIFGNDVIEDGFGNLNGTYYKVQVFTVDSKGIIASTPSLQNFYAFTGSGTVDLSTATPLAPSYQTGTLGSVTVPNTIAFNGATSGSTTVEATAIASGTLTLPATTDQLVGRATTDTLTNKTIGAGGLAGLTIHAAAPASGPWTIPTGITSVKFTIIGAGGGGGGAVNAGAVGAGGGSGATAIKYLSGLTPGDTITITVGTGGTGGSGNGGTGGASSISSGTQTIGTVTAGGGGGGASFAGVTGGGNPGTASGGDINLTGSYGGPIYSPAAGVGGIGAASTLGGGGAISGGAPSAGVINGAGGSGAGNSGSNNGGAGANGYVLIERAS